MKKYGIRTVVAVGVISFFIGGLAVFFGLLNYY